MSEYYSHNLSGSRLKQVYDLAPPRVKQYLNAELDYVQRKIHSGDLVLELGCGYGRVIPKLAERAAWVVGIDISLASLRFGQRQLEAISNCSLLRMNANMLGFEDQSFNCVICIQNGISAFHVDKRSLIVESIRVTKRGGIVLFSSYSDKFWEERLHWFELQAKAGLLGEIDYDKTKDGIIACKDGFTATIVRPEEFKMLTVNLNADARDFEIDRSSVIYEMTPQNNQYPTSIAPH
ncbi:MAG TPA: class I SAM-dependent methyltransferase [Terriglobales bacterium]|nr:class I SAM-dependent methyltransferase [Terriglobales bacterium]